MLNEVNKLNCAWLITRTYIAIKKYGYELLEVDNEAPDSVTLIDREHSNDYVELIAYICDNCEDHIEEPFHFKKSTLKRLI